MEANRLHLIKRCPEYVAGYKEYCRELHENKAVYFRPTNPDAIDEDWFSHTEAWYKKREKGMVESKSPSFHYWAVDDGKYTTSIHVCEKLGGKLQDTIEAYNEAEGKRLLRRYWIYL